MRRFELRSLLETVDEFGSASRELVAWEYGLDQEAIEPVWRAALDDGLIRFIGQDAQTGEAMYTLTRQGRARLRRLRQRDGEF